MKEGFFVTLLVVRFLRTSLGFCREHVDSLRPRVFRTFVPRRQDKHFFLILLAPSAWPAAHGTSAAIAVLPLDERTRDQTFCSNKVFAHSSIQDKTHTKIENYLGTDRRHRGLVESDQLSYTSEVRCGLDNTNICASNYETSLNYMFPASRLFLIIFKFSLRSTFTMLKHQALLRSFFYDYIELISFKVQCDVTIFIIIGTLILGSFKL